MNCPQKKWDLHVWDVKTANWVFSLCYWCKTFAMKNNIPYMVGWENIWTSCYSILRYELEINTTNRVHAFMHDKQIPYWFVRNVRIHRMYVKKWLLHFRWCCNVRWGLRCQILQQEINFLFTSGAESSPNRSWDSKTCLL